MTPILKIKFRGLPRIERRTGFTDPKMTARLKEMLRTLHEAGREDILRDLQAGQLSLRDAWSFYRRGDWRKIPTPQHAWDFRMTFAAWYERKPLKSYQTAAKWAMNCLAGPGDTLALGALRSETLKVRAAREAAGERSAFNRMLDKVQAFLRDTVTTDHQLYQELASITMLPEVRGSKRPKNAQRPEQAAAIRESLGGELGRIWWAMCCSGMLPDEYFAGKWAVEDGRLHIKGTKRQARDRYVPLLAEVSQGSLSQQQFERALRKSGLGVRPKDARDSYALWCDLADIPWLWREGLLGHARGTMDYGAVENERVFGEIEAKLRRLLGIEVEIKA